MIRPPILLVAAAALLLARPAPCQMPTGTPPVELLGAFRDDYGSSYRISVDTWTQLPRMTFHVVEWHMREQYLLAWNDSSNTGAPGKWTRIDWVLLPGMTPYEWGFCLSAYEAPTRAAADSSHAANRSAPKTGCNGFPFTRMRRPE